MVSLAVAFQNDCWSAGELFMRRQAAWAMRSREESG